MPEMTLSPFHVRKFSKDPVIAFYQSSIGKKIVVGVTALFLILYVLGHLIGNLQIYMGQNQINAYAKLLHDSLGRPDVYRMLILGFRHPLVSLFYVLAHFLLASHLSHGFESVTQTLGINNRRISRFVSTAGQTLTWLIFAGYVSIPATILGLIK